MAAKRPTGERPKRNSNLSNFISTNYKVDKLNQAQSRVAAGKYRDIVKKTGAKTMDQTGVALGKAIASTKKSGPTKTSKPATKPAARSKAGASTVAAVAKRFGVTAREARDIATAIGTYGTLKFDPDSKYDRYSTQKIEKAKAVKNIKKQISETVTAAKTGKKGTSSGRATFSDGEVPYTYSKGKKRK